MLTKLSGTSDADMRRHLGFQFSKGNVVFQDYLLKYALHSTPMLCNVGDHSNTNGKFRSGTDNFLFYMEPYPCRHYMPVTHIQLSKVCNVEPI